MSNNTIRHFLIAMVSIVTFFGLMAEVTIAQSYDVDESGNVVFYSPDGSQSVSKENLIKPNHGVVLFGYQNTYTDVIDATILPRALGNNRAIANSETRIGRYYSTLSQGEIQNNGFDVGQEHQGVVSSGSESWAYSHLVKINQLRYEHGLAPVSINLNASGYAYNKSEDMVNSGYFAHKNPEGENIITQYLAYNPEDEGVHAVGENIAQAYPSTATSIEAQVFDDLLHSPGHYQNMVDPAWDSVGIGFYYNPAISDKVHFVQLFYTTDYNQKNGVLTDDALAQYYWNYEFYQEKHNPEAFNDFVVEAPVEEEIEEVVEETEVAVEEETALEDDVAFEEAVQLEETLRAEVEEKRQAQSEAAEALAANEAEIARVELENTEVLTPYRAALMTIEEKELELLDTEDQVLRDEIQAEIDAANLVIEELQDAVAVVNVVLDPLNEQQEVLENTVAERAEEKRIAEENLMEQSEKVASMEQVGNEEQEVTVEDEAETEAEEPVEIEEEVAEEEVVEEEVATEAEGDISFESEEEPTTSNYNVNLQNNIVELQQNTTPPAVEDRSENVEEVEEESTEEESAVEEADLEEETSEEVDETNAEDAESEVEEEQEEQVEQTEERNLSDFIGRSAGNDDDSEDDILGTLLPETGLAQNTWLILGAVVLLAIGGLLLFFTARRKK